MHSRAGDETRPGTIQPEMTDNAGDNSGTAGRGLLTTAWALAFGPFAIFFFNLSPKTDYQWLWRAFPVLLWGFPGTALACAVVLTRHDTTIWKKFLAGWRLGYRSSLVGGCLTSTASKRPPHCRAARVDFLALP